MKMPDLFPVVFCGACNKRVYRLPPFVCPHCGVKNK